MRRTVLARVVLVVVGVGLLLAPAAEPTASYQIDASPVSESAVPEEASVVAYESLSAPERADFRAALETDGAVEAGTSSFGHGYVSYEGTVYGVTPVVVDPGSSLWDLVRPLIGVGAVAVAVAWATLARLRR